MSASDWMALAAIMLSAGVWVDRYIERKRGKGDR